MEKTSLGWYASTVNRTWLTLMLRSITRHLANFPDQYPPHLQHGI